MEVLFWILLALIVYTFIGYGIVATILVLLKRFLTNREVQIYSSEDLLETTLVIAAYNEEDTIKEKIENTLQLDFPKGKLRIIFVTDGSSDDTPKIVWGYPEIELYHQTERKGKIHATNRILSQITSPIIVFSDANTNLNEDALIKLVRHYKNPKVGAVAGEKKIVQRGEENAAGAGEGIYWKYESFLKKLDSKIYSVVGAAGELFSVRRELYDQVPDDMIIEDFYMTLKIAQNGFRVVYEPAAMATEYASESTGEEWKRKVRIAAGGIQAIIKLSGLFNIFRHGILTFQYVSHRVLRWTITPFALIGCLLLNGVLTINSSSYFGVIMSAQLLFYLFAAFGWILNNRKMKVKIFFVPFYFVMMNMAVFAGILRFIKGSQSVIWEKAKRSKGQY